MRFCSPTTRQSKQSRQSCRCPWRNTVSPESFATSGPFPFFANLSSGSQDMPCVPKGGDPAHLSGRGICVNDELSVQDDV